jgi:hypothetical protein
MRIFLTAIFLLFMTGCFPNVDAYYIRKETDPIEKTERLEMRANPMADEKGEHSILEGNTKYDLGIVKIISPDQKNPRYFLRVWYQGDGWIFINEGESLVLLMDGEKTVFSGSGSSGDREVIYGGFVWEVALYPVTEKQIRKISNAKDITVKIIGSKGYVIRKFDETNFENFRHFIVEVIEGGTWTETAKAPVSTIRQK